MAKRAAIDRRKRVTDALGRMLRDYLQTHVFKETSIDDLARRISVMPNIVQLPWWQDIPLLVEGAGLDLGIAVRDAKGNEVTFFPEENLRTPAKEPKVASKNYDVAPSALSSHSKK